ESRTAPLANRGFAVADREMGHEGGQRRGMEVITEAGPSFYPSGIDCLGGSNWPATRPAEGPPGEPSRRPSLAAADPALASVLAPLFDNLASWGLPTPLVHQAVQGGSDGG